MKTSPKIKRRSDGATERRKGGRGVGVALLACSLVFALGQSQSIVDTPHNLSAGGPGSIRASSEQEICIFCHAPHNASNVQPLWNRSMSTAVYTVYRSNSLEAEPGQPTGASKMCLSCHDGTIALGSVVSRSSDIHMSGGGWGGGASATLRSGRTNLSTDLSDDHPISFRYDSSLAIRKGGGRVLVDPRSIPHALRLDGNGELQCTTCHDPHNNTHGYFLVMSNEDSAMCRSCHTLSSTDVQSHSDCASCHKPHAAPSGPYLLRGDRITSTCLACHDGSRAGAANIAALLNRLSTHDTFSAIEPANPIPGSTQGHATCADCHDPHTMRSGVAMGGGGGAPHIPPTFGSVPGVSASGSTLAEASYEYEVCFRCHGDQNGGGTVTTSPPPRRITRQIAQTNLRLQFSPSAISFHPVVAPGKNLSVPSLRAPWTSGSMMYCSDCHGSDTSRKAGGSGPDGLHGSNAAPLLIARYETADFTMESPSAYALCYRCHERDGAGGILSDASFRYHRLHIVDNRTPCSACHDSHGISSAQGTAIKNASLMNFDIGIVSPDPVTGRLEFRDEGTFAGSCYLSCHGVNHSPKSY